MKGIGLSRFGVAPLVGFVLATLLMLAWATVAHAQTATDQYGSPTEPTGAVSHALGVLPETGGAPLLLIVGAALVLGGTALALLRRRASHQ